MFRNTLSQTPVSSPAADAFWENKISGDSFRTDTTFVSTLRVLLNDRLPEGTNFHFRVATGNVPDRFNQVDTSDAVTLYVSNRDFSPDDVATKILASRDGLKRIQKVTDFYANVMKVVCIVDEANRLCMLVTTSIDMGRYHYLQCGILACLPWYFDPKKGVSEQEMALIQSLRQDNSEKYEAVLAEFVSQFDIQTPYMEKSLRGFESSYLTGQKAALEDKIARISDTIQNYLESINREMVEQSATQAMLLGIRQKLKEGESDELINYFKANKNIKFESLTNGAIDFMCRGPISYWDEDIAEEYVENADSILYDDDDGNYGYDCDDQCITPEEMKPLLRALFVDKTIKMNFCAAFKIQSGGGITARRGVAFPHEFDDCMPNPHIQKYSCMGTNVPVIEQYLMEHRYIEAIEQCQASCRSLNFKDPTVLGGFMCDLYNMSEGYKVFILPNGEVVDIYTALDYLKGEAK